MAFASFFGFTLLQFAFALGAHSQAMMADCAAMAVDAMTYLFNYGAEHVKHLQHHGHHHHRTTRQKLQVLYLELIPPSISVTTLIAVTVVSFKQAIQVLLEDDADDAVSPDVLIMLVFSALNLALDGVNVFCFAKRAEDNVVGIPSNLLAMDQYHHHDNTNTTHANHQQQNRHGDTELTGLLLHKSIAASAGTETDITSYTTPCTTDCDDENFESDNHSTTSSEDSTTNHLNLNMCSAWTHVCADTLRSITTLVAAGLSFAFPTWLSPADADSWGAIIISLIILVSLGPLIQGLYSTAMEIRELLWRETTVATPIQQQPRPQQQQSPLKANMTKF